MAIQDFTAGQILTAAQMDNLQANDYNQTVSTKTANYTLAATDKGTRVVMNAAGATTITVNTSIFAAGDTLYLQNIGAGTCTVTAGTATVSSAGPLAIPQYGSGTLYFTSAGVAIYFPSAVTTSSAVVQVKSTTLNTTFSGTATLATFMAVTGLTVSITPTSASNKVLLLASINVDNTAKTQQGISAILTGGNTTNYRGVANGTMQQAAIGQGVFDNSRVVSNMNFNYLDSPATTSAITYGVSINYLANGAGTQVLYVNRASTYDDVNYGATYASTITAIEVTP